mgnify:CR=1 FL=1
MISFAICTHNEGAYIQELLAQLVIFCDTTGDQIIVVDDFSTDEYTKVILDRYSNDLGAIKLYQHPLNNDFAAHKNFLNDMCTGDYIFQVDADETFHRSLLENLHEIVYSNDDIDLFYVPRVNIVHGLTDDDAKRWGWTINDLGWNCWPDYQGRLYRKNPSIKWEGKVHERIVGHKAHAFLPTQEEYALYHIKTIDRQRLQNSFYSTL